MGSDCSNCTKCDLGILSEKQNEIDRQSLEYRKRNINREELINNNINKIIEYYNNHLPTIIYLQNNIKKYLKKLQHLKNPQDNFYNKYYGSAELSPENLEIILTNNDNNDISDTNNKENIFHKIQNSKEKFRTLSEKYSSFQNNNIEQPEENKSYKVKDLKINDKAKYTGDMLNGKQNGKWKTKWIWNTRME